MNLHILKWRDEDIAQADNLWRWSVRARRGPRLAGKAYVLMSEVLEQLQLSVSTLGEDRGAERLHDLLDRDRLAGQLVPRRASGKTFRSAMKLSQSAVAVPNIPDKPEGTHAHRLQVRIPRIHISAKRSAAGQSQAMRTGQ